ncbi:MAG: hypothetical protein ACJAYF_001315 [Arenicella sp.]|jgi:hypothetical protein
MSQSIGVEWINWEEMGGIDSHPNRKRSLQHTASHKPAHKADGAHKPAA